MKVLDLGCGRAKSSIFLAKEFGVEVWAADLWIAPDENEERVAKQQLSDRIHCVHTEAMRLPFEFGQFDAVLAFDSIQYFGTDAIFLPYIAQFLKPVSYTHLRAHETLRYLVCRLLLEKKK